MLERDIGKQSGNASKAARALRSLTEIVERGIDGIPDLADIDTAQVVSNWRTRITDLGSRGAITVTDQPAISLEILVDKSARWVSPFQAGDKGFKDSLIWDCVLNHCSVESGRIEVVLLSRDKVFSQTKSDLKKQLAAASGISVSEVTYTSLESISEYLKTIRVPEGMWRQIQEQDGIRKSFESRYRNLDELRLAIDIMIDEGPIDIGQVSFEDVGSQDAVVTSINSISNLKVHGVVSGYLDDFYFADVTITGSFDAEMELVFPGEQLSLVLNMPTPQLEMPLVITWNGRMRMLLMVDDEGAVSTEVGIGVTQIEHL